MTRLARSTTSMLRGRSRSLLPGIKAPALAASLVLGAVGWVGAEGGGWQSLPDLDHARQEVASAHVAGALYVVGGFGLDRSTLASAERLQDGAAAWEELPAMPVGVNHPAAASVGGRLFVFGGFEGPGLQNPTDAVQVFDPATGSWSSAAPMPSRRGGLAAAVVDGMVVVVGGARDGVSVADAAVYDPTGDAWRSVPDMPTARDHLGAATVDGRVHVIGGRAGRDFTMGVHEVFDPTGESWSSAEPMPTGRSGHAVAALDGCVYALGGEGNPATADAMFSEVERYRVADGTWESLAAMPLPRHGMGAVPVGDRLLVPAGATIAGFGATNAADAFTPPPCDAQ